MITSEVDKKNYIYKKELASICKYLMNIKPTEQHCELYMKAINNYGLNIYTVSEKKIWDGIVKHPLALTFIDAWLGVYKRQSTIRKRIFFAIAILEASPESHNYVILPKKNKLILIVKIITIFAILPLKAFLGFLFYIYYSWI